MHDGIAQVANAPSVVRKAEGYTRRLLTGWRKARYDILILLWVVATAQFWVWWLDPGHIPPGIRYWVATLAFFCCSSCRPISC